MHKVFLSTSLSRVGTSRQRRTRSTCHRVTRRTDRSHLWLSLERSTWSLVSDDVVLPYSTTVPTLLLLPRRSSRLHHPPLHSHPAPCSRCPPPLPLLHRRHAGDGEGDQGPRARRPRGKRRSLISFHPLIPPPGVLFSSLTDFWAGRRCDGRRWRWASPRKARSGSGTPPSASTSSTSTSARGSTPLPCPSRPVPDQSITIFLHPVR